MSGVVSRKRRQPSAERGGEKNAAAAAEEDGGGGRGGADAPFHEGITRLLGLVYGPRNPWRRSAWAWSMAGLALLLAEGYFNVSVSNARRDFINAMTNKDEDGFWLAIWRFVYILVVASFLYSLIRFACARTAHEWRRALTTQLVDSYFDGNSFYHIAVSYPEIDFPGQRIVDDVRVVCADGISLLSVLVEKAVTVATFSYILYTTEPRLMYFCMAYSVAATWMTHSLFSAKLTDLHSAITTEEASLRQYLVSVFVFREPIAFFTVASGEAHDKACVHRRLASVDGSRVDLMSVEAWLNTMQETLRYLTTLLPYLVAADRLFHGDLQYGDVSQAASAFFLVRSGLQLAVTRLQSITTLRLHVNRLAGLVHALDRTAGGGEGSKKAGRLLAAGGAGAPPAGDELLVVDNVTLRTPVPASGGPAEPRVLLRGVSFGLRRGGSILVMGANGTGKTTLFRAICGLAPCAAGSVAVPERLFVLPERAYSPEGGLRAQLWYPFACPAPPGAGSSDATLVELLHKVGLGGLPALTRGWDEPCDVGTILSPGQQQRLGFVRLLRAKPHVALLDESSSCLDEAGEEQLYSLLSKSGTSYISIGHRTSLLKHHKQVLLLRNGAAHLMSAAAYREQFLQATLDGNSMPSQRRLFFDPQPRAAAAAGLRSDPARQAARGSSRRVLFVPGRGWRGAAVFPPRPRAARRQHRPPHEPVETPQTSASTAQRRGPPDDRCSIHRPVPAGNLIAARGGCFLVSRHSSRLESPTANRNAESVPRCEVQDALCRSVLSKPRIQRFSFWRLWQQCLARVIAGASNTGYLGAIHAEFLHTVDLLYHQCMVAVGGPMVSSTQRNKSPQLKSGFRPRGPPLQPGTSEFRSSRPQNILSRLSQTRHLTCLDESGEHRPQPRSAGVYGNNACSVLVSSQARRIPAIWVQFTRSTCKPLICCTTNAWLPLVARW
ncbi:putative ABC transporter ATP-binding protein [Diplonema papillatum]|nr:putative ABC transporter ATP-binding protein [Diplonema papillatum]